MEVVIRMMIKYDVRCIFFFFFQAEDGIRDYKVTGVQTCALPIYPARDPRPAAARPRADSGAPSSAGNPARAPVAARCAVAAAAVARRGGGASDGGGAGRAVPGVGGGRPGDARGVDPQASQRAREGAEIGRAHV